jgi:hypothetical protein
VQAWLAGDHSTAAALADEALELALRAGNPTSMARVHYQCLIVHYIRGDLATAENYFAAGLKFFDDPSSGKILAPLLSRFSAGQA